MKAFLICTLLIFSTAAYGDANQDHTCQGGHNCNGGAVGGDGGAGGQGGAGGDGGGAQQDQGQDQNQDQGQSQSQDVNVENNLSLLGGSGADGSVEIGTSSNTFTESPSSSYAYAAVCGTAIGAGTFDFTGSVSGESQHCKYLRMAAFYEGMYREAVARDDNPMARLWYGQMTSAAEKAQSLIESTAWTGAAKENSADLALPVILCGAVAVVTAGWAGVACGVIIAGKATADYEAMKKSGELPDIDLYINNRDFTSRPDAQAAELLK